MDRRGIEPPTSALRTQRYTTKPPAPPDRRTLTINHCRGGRRIRGAGGRPRPGEGASLAGKRVPASAARPRPEAGPPRAARAAPAGAARLQARSVPHPAGGAPAGAPRSRAPARAPRSRAPARAPRSRAPAPPASRSRARPPRPNPFLPRARRGRGGRVGRARPAPMPPRPGHLPVVAGPPFSSGKRAPGAGALRSSRGGRARPRFPSILGPRRSARAAFSFARSAMLRRVGGGAAVGGRGRRDLGAAGPSGEPVRRGFFSAGDRAPGQLDSRARGTGPPPPPPCRSCRARRARRARPGCGRPRSSRCPAAGGARRGADPSSDARRTRGIRALKGGRGAPSRQTGGPAFPCSQSLPRAPLSSRNGPIGIARRYPRGTARSASRAVILAERPDRHRAPLSSRNGPIGIARLAIRLAAVARADPLLGLFQPRGRRAAPRASGALPPPPRPDQARRREPGRDGAPRPGLLPNLLLLLLSMSGRYMATIAARYL